MGIADSLMSSLYSLEGFPAYALVFGLLLGSGFGLPINEDILLLGAAALTLKGVMDPIPLIAVAWFGVLAADTLIFHWGHQFGARLLRHRLFARLMPPRRLASMQAAMRALRARLYLPCTVHAGGTIRPVLCGRFAEDALSAPVRFRRRRGSRWSCLCWCMECAM